MYTTVRPLPSASSATWLPSVAGRLSAGMARPGRWLAAPSSAGTGRPAGSRSRSGPSMAVSSPASPGDDAPRPASPGPCCQVNTASSPAPPRSRHRCHGAWQGRTVADIRIRDAVPEDTGAIARVATAAGQDEEWSGSDPAYVGHLLARGLLVVAEHRGAVAGYGATVRIGAGPAAVTMLCDLFVDPRSHGLGLGQSMLAALWRDGTPRMTFSSLHAHALPLYTRSGLDAWWPLLYLGGQVTALAAPAGWAVTSTTAGEAGGLEHRWTGVD